MGEAKRRGTREVRVAQAIEADAAYHAELRRKADEAEGEPGGYRFMRRGYISAPYRSLAELIDMEHGA